MDPLDDEELNLPESADDAGESLYEHHRFTADPKQKPERIDKFIQLRLSNVSRNKVQAAIDLGFVSINDKPTKSSYKIKPGDVIVVAFPKPQPDYTLEAEDIPLNIVYEDDDLLILNKPAGLVVHPGVSNWTGTLVNGLLHHFQNLPMHRNGEIRPGLVHRIDKDTSGLMVIAKTDTAMTHLAKQFFHHTIERTYWALVWGSPKESQGTINVHLGKHPKDHRLTYPYPDGSQGRHAITHYKVLADMHYVSLVECKLETGRTHQIRAHMKYLGHPLFSDAPYGGDKVLKGTTHPSYKRLVEHAMDLLPRQALHAKTLGFEHPSTGQWVQFDSELATDFQAALTAWQEYIDKN